eukprot:gene6314-1126_t
MGIPSTVASILWVASATASLIPTPVASPQPTPQSTPKFTPESSPESTPEPHTPFPISVIPSPLPTPHASDPLSPVPTPGMAHAVLCAHRDLYGLAVLVGTVCQSCGSTSLQVQQLSHHPQRNHNRQQYRCPPPVPEPADDGSSAPSWLPILIVIAGVAVVCLLFLICAFFLYRQRQRSAKEKGAAGHPALTSTYVPVGPMGPGSAVQEMSGAMYSTQPVALAPPLPTVASVQPVDSQNTRIVLPPSSPSYPNMINIPDTVPSQSHLAASIVGQPHIQDVGPASPAQAMAPEPAITVDMDPATAVRPILNPEGSNVVMLEQTRVSSCITPQKSVPSYAHRLPIPLDGLPQNSSPVHVPSRTPSPLVVDEDEPQPVGPGLTPLCPRAVPEDEEDPAVQDPPGVTPQVVVLEDPPKTPPRRVLSPEETVEAYTKSPVHKQREIQDYVSANCQQAVIPTSANTLIDMAKLGPGHLNHVGAILNS